MSDVFYLTTPLYYVNARPHLGHAYATLLGDGMKRMALLQGKKVFFLTGTDEHGEKIAKAARAQNSSPQSYTDEISALFAEAWKRLGVEADVFYRTTLPAHYTQVKNALQRLKDKGDIHFATYSGKYCVGCERFRTDLEWDENGLCPDHRTPPEMREESNYFFKMSRYQAQLKKFYADHPESIVPGNYLRETLSMLEAPLDDLCISRPKERLEWGIPLPFDDKYVTYVWFDALLSYTGGVGYTGIDPKQDSKFRLDFWKNVTHLIGKDILKTHAVYWPTMLLALDLPIFQHLQVSGWWLTAGVKMSKSLGNIVDPLKIQEKYGHEVLRYYLLRDMSYGQDASFTWEAFIGRINSDLANGIGNLASRTLTLSQKNLDAKVPSRASRQAVDNDFLAQVHQLPATFLKEWNDSRFHIALTAFGDTVALCDRYINDQKPWSLAKDPAQKSRLEAVLGTAMDALNCLSVVMAPVLIEGSAKLRKALGQPEVAQLKWSQATEQLPEGQSLGETPRLYPRLELDLQE